MKKYNKYIFLIFLIGAIFYFFKPFFLDGRLPIPSDTIIGLYHPFRDLYAPQYPNGITFKNFLITDPVRQIIPWKELAISDLKHLSLPLWNPYEMAGKPLLGNFQSSPFYPLNILLLIFPFSFGWSIMVFLQPLLAGIFLYLYLRKMRIHPAASALGGIAFSFSGFTVSWLEWSTIVQVALWLPFILYIKENLLKKFTLKWGLMLLFVECAVVFAGHLQVLFYSLITSNAYLLSRIYQISRKESRKNIFLAMTRIYLPFLGIGVLILLFTAIQWFPTLQFILQSARNIDQEPFTNPGWFIPWQHLVQFVAPDFFGNPTTLNYWGVWNYAEFVGYVGLIPLMFAFLAILFRRDKKTLFFGTFLLLSLLFSLPTPLAKIPYFFNIPFLSTAQPTRLLFITSFSLVILSALGMDLFVKEFQNRGKIMKQSLILFLVFAAIFAFLWGFVFFGKSMFGVALENISVTKRNLMLPTILFICFTTYLFATLILRKKKAIISIVYLIILLIVAFDLLRFANKFTPFTNKEYFFPNTKVIDFLKKQDSLFRVATTDSRIFPPNFSTHYKIQSIEGYDPLYLRSYAEFIAAMERGKPNINPPFGFNRIITPRNINSKLFDLLNVKYVLSLSEIKNEKFQKVFQEGETRVYENKNVIPRAFFVTTIIPINNKQLTINAMYGEDVDPGKTAVIEDLPSSIFTPGEWGEGRVIAKLYSEQKVIMETDNAKKGFLVLTDSFYPGWKAYVDGIETKIYRTDYHFRGIFVPEGKHSVEFSTHLF